MRVLAIVAVFPSDPMKVKNLYQKYTGRQVLQATELVLTAGGSENDRRRPTGF
jgi:hypothetical protein